MKSKGVELMLINRNRKDGHPEIANKANVYLDGEKIERCLEASTQGSDLKSYGYVIYPSDAGDTLLYGLKCKKVYGEVEIRIE